MLVLGPIIGLIIIIILAAYLFYTSLQEPELKVNLLCVKYPAH